MSNALSRDLRTRFKQLMDRGMSAAAAGKALLISRATAARWGNKVRNGASLEPLPCGPRKGSGKLSSHMSFFIELIDEDGDITLDELRGALFDAYGIACSISGIDVALRRHGYTFKKSLGRNGARQSGRAAGARSMVPPPEGHEGAPTAAGFSG